MNLGMRTAWVVKVKPFASLIRGRLHGEFQPGLNFGPPTGLKFSCDYMVNFSKGGMLKTGRETFVGKCFAFTTQAVRMPKFIFQPGLETRSRDCLQCVTFLFAYYMFGANN